MVLEAVMLCIDTSELMRNMDYPPSRLDGVVDCCNTLITAKLADNQESAVGFLTSAGKRIEVHMTFSREENRLSTAIEALKCEGKSQWLNAIKTAQLVLKNRQNKSQKQRIIAFIGSPIDASVEDLTALGKALKKNSVAIDLICFGTENFANGNNEKAEALIAAVNQGDNSRIVFVRPGAKISDFVLSSGIMSSESGPANPVAAGPANARAPAPGANDVVEDDLALALRLSLEEENRRGASAIQAAVRESLGAPGAAASNPAPANQPVVGGPAPMEGVDLDAESNELLQRAIALSLAPVVDSAMPDAKPASSAAASSSSSAAAAAPSSAPASASASASASATAPASASSASAAPGAKGSDLLDKADLAHMLDDPDFISSLLGDAGVAADPSVVDELVKGVKGNQAKKPDDKPKDK